MHMETRMPKLTLAEIRDHAVTAGSIAIWWLGQAGFLFKSPGGTIVALDPYLSNSCKEIGDEHGFDMDRQVPAPIAPVELVGVDLYVLTHSHQDHFDPETIGPYREAGGSGPFLAPAETVEKLLAMGVAESDVVMSWPNKTHRVGDLTLRTTFAIPFAGDDLTHVGYLAQIDDGPTVYFTGDTDYHDILPAAVGDHHPDVLVAVINGAFRNMGPAQAARLAHELEVKVVIPCHHDLFLDNIQPPQMLRTNLNILGIADRYRPIEHGVPYVYPES